VKTTQRIAEDCGLEEQDLEGYLNGTIGALYRRIEKLEEEFEAAQDMLEQAVARNEKLEEGMSAIAKECEKQGDNEYNYEIGRVARNAIRGSQEGA
jgi:hypothetical protein